MSQAPITSFRGEYRFLSNFWPVSVSWEGLTYPSTEHAYQAAKAADFSLRRGFTIGSPGEAKRRGRRIEIRRDWEQVKLQVMLDLLRLKFGQPDMRRLLRTTGQRELVEGNTWGDTFWGVCDGRGENHLGRLLMQVRSEIAADVS